MQGSLHSNMKHCLSVHPMKSQFSIFLLSNYCSYYVSHPAKMQPTEEVRGEIHTVTLSGVATASIATSGPQSDLLDLTQHKWRQFMVNGFVLTFV